jgi:hypothetical protein
MSVFKTLTSNDVTITPFKLHKSVQFDEGDLSTLNIQEKKAKLRVINLEYEDILSAKNVIDLSNENIVYNQLNHLYFNENYVQFYDTFGNIDPQNTERKLLGQANILSISHTLYGYEIKPDTLTISGSITVKDDGKGNIYDTSFNTSSFISNDNRVLYLDFRNQLDKMDEFKQ